MLSKEDLEKLVPVVGHHTRLWNTIEKIRNGSVYVCFKCDERFQKLELLSQHLKKNHKLTEFCDYVCPHCTRLYNRKSYLRHFRDVFKLHSQLMPLPTIIDQPVTNELDVYVQALIG
jgi:uncharacterized C2H2 Zn-finger protein